MFFFDCSSLKNRPVCSVGSCSMTPGPWRVAHACAVLRWEFWWGRDAAVEGVRCYTQVCSIYPENCHFLETPGRFLFLCFDLR